MRILTERFGEVEVQPENVLVFPQGLLGFEEYKKYVILDEKDSFFWFLQSVEEAELVFVVLMPELLRSDYQVCLEGPMVKELGFTDASEGQVYVIVTVPENIAEMTANLQAPLVINTKKKLAKQVVLMDGKYHTKHNVLAEFQRTTFEQKKKDQSVDQPNQELRRSV